MKPIRFGVLTFRLAPNGQYPKYNWINQVKRLEELGYSTFFISDHFNTRYEPIATQAAVAAVTQKLKIGSLVYSVDFRHPAVLAHAAATIHLISNGRHEFGIGAGWRKSEYEASGISFDKPSVRIERLDEALTIIKSLWTQESTTIDGNHYKIKGLPTLTKMPEGIRPKILVGGGGRKVLSVAGRHADIVCLNPSIPKGRYTSDTGRDFSYDDIQKKIKWIYRAAESSGRERGEIELAILHLWMSVTDDKQAAYKKYSEQLGIPPEVIADCPIFLIGSYTEMRETIERLHREHGITYFIIRGNLSNFYVVLEEFAETVIKPLSKNR